MNHVSDTVSAQPPLQDARDIAEAWLTAFDDALHAQDAAGLGALFHEDCHWRDILAFTWDLSAERGRTAITEGLASLQAKAGAHGFRVSAERRGPLQVTRYGHDSVEVLFDFTTAVGTGAGMARLSKADDGTMRAWHLSTMLEELEGHAEKIGANRPTGSAYSRNFGGDNWADMRRKAAAYEDREPTVLVVGGAQAGLCIAARLNQVGIDTLVVEQWPRIGDSWRKRYHSLALHNSIHLNHLPYMEFPPTWPKYIPKDMLGDWFEFYAHVMEINCWTDTEFVAGEWDEATKTWAATVKRGDGTERVFRPKHLVMANGVSSYPYIPDLPGLEDFQGEIIHSEGFDTGANWTGKRAVIIGTGSSANDIALDLHSFGVDTTLVQRGSTTVVSIDPSARLNEALFDEGPTLADSDLLVASTTPDLMVQGYKAVTKRMVELDKEMIEGLLKIGFKHDMGDDEAGHQMKYFRRGGGYNLDAGSSELMIKGEIGLLQYENIQRFTAEGVQLTDGSARPIDVIVMATGYLPQKELVNRALGQEIADKIGPVWGLNDKNELNNMYRRTPQEGLWFIAGGIAQCRINSKYIALQILAMELGLLGPLEA